jgi:hypothetical protein
MNCEALRAAFHEADKYDMEKPIHRQCTNVYKCKDGRWYHLHGSMNAGPTMKMLGIPEQDVTTLEAQKIYMDKVALWDSEAIDKTSNEQFFQAGTICNTPEEFFASPHVCNTTSLFTASQG